MRLLIAGWQGQLARALVETASSRTDISALALGRPALDLCEVRAIERALTENRPDVVINTAGYTAIDAAEDEPDRAFALNRDGARLLAEVAARRGVPVIHMSTVNVFDGSKPAPYAETDKASPINVYGASKLAGESDVQEANPCHVILRTSWIISPYRNHFIASVLQKMRSGDVLRMVTDQRGNPTYAPDLSVAVFDIAARAHTARGNLSSSLWGTYHIANAGEPATWHDLASQVLCAAGHQAAATDIERIATRNFATRASRPANAALDTSRLAATLGVTLRNWRAAISDAVQRLTTHP